MTMKFLTAVASLALAVSSQAADLSFNRLSLGYTQLDTDCSTNCDGFGLAGGIGFNENFFGVIDYRRYEGSVGLSFVDVGYRWNQTDTSAFFVTLGFARLDYDSSDLSDPTVGIGLRGMFSPSFELEGNLRYIAGSSGSGDAVLDLGGTYFFTESAGLNIALRGADGIASTLIGARFNF